MSTAAEVFSYVPTYLPGWTGWWWSSATAAAAEEKEWLLAPTKKLSMVRVLWPQQRLTLIRSMFFRPGRSFFIHGWHGVVSMLVFYTLVFLTFFFFIWANAFRISSSLAVLVGDFFACGWLWLGWSTEGRIGEDITRHRWWWWVLVRCACELNGFLFTNSLTYLLGLQVFWAKCNPIIIIIICRQLILSVLPKAHWDNYINRVLRRRRWWWWSQNYPSRV